jgi:1-acyl-sn-glycerol-3-phosphate acyltransferase
MSDPTIADHATTNGHSNGAHSERGGATGSFQDRLKPLSGLADGSGLSQAAAGAIGAGQRAAAGILGRAARAMGERMTADLDDRDPDFIREQLPLAWLFSTLWYRAEVRNMGNVPEDGAALLVGNHSGGNMAPEIATIPLAFSTYFGVERRFYQLAHNLVLASPVGGYLKKFGTMAASHDHAKRALRSGAVVLVFPGGDWEVHRPSWERSRVDLAGRKGFIKLALSENVPIVPVVTAGGQETALFLSRGAWLSKALQLDRLFRLKVLPISLSLPWIVNVGDFLGHIPLPAKITTEILPAIDLHDQFGAEPDVDEVYAHVTRVMQEALDSLYAERRLPVIG